MKITLIQQMIRIKILYPNLVESISVHNNQLRCIMKLKPSAESNDYLVKIELHDRFKPQVWLLSPEIKMVNDKLPHHIYAIDEHGHPKLCVFHPSEWNSNMYLADSFIPWIVTWLNTYEYWQLTGEWFFDEYKTDHKKSTKKNH